MRTIFLFLIPLCLLTASIAQNPATDDPCQPLKIRQQEIESTLRDWPNLARFRDAAAELGLPAKGENRIIFLGDSITQNWNLADFFPGKPYVNRGISGQTTPQILLRIRQDVIELKPKAVVILAGTNDIAENTGPISIEAIEGNLASMVELAQKNGIRVILASVLPAARYNWRPAIQPIEKIRSLNQWMKEYASRTGIEYLDYYSAMVDQKSRLKDELGTDGVHPNSAGYAVMARLADKVIAVALAK
jgi:lysophospholipase L1-like esterase